MSDKIGLEEFMEEPITIEYSKANGGPRKYKTQEEALEFLIKEFEVWQQVFDISMSSNLEGINGTFNDLFPNPNKHPRRGVELFLEQIKKYQLPYSKSQIGLLIQEVKSEQDTTDAGALAVLNYFSNWKPKASYLSPDWGLGQMKAFAHENNLSPSKTEKINKSLEVELLAGRKALETINGLIAEKEKLYEESLTRSVKRFEKEAIISLTGMKDAEKSLKATDKAYAEQMGLQAASEYWNIRSASHAKSEKIWGVVLVLYTFISLTVGFYLANGIWESVINVSEYGPDYKYGHIKALSMSVLLFTFIIWGARIIARSYLSNQHLKTDALERRTMIMTYLALTYKGKVSEAERALVLEPIFRPTSDGLVKDDGAPNILASLISRGGSNQV